MLIYQPGEDRLSSVDLEDVTEALQAALVNVDTRDHQQLSMIERLRRYLTGTYHLYLTGKYINISLSLCILVANDYQLPINLLHY